MIGAQPGDTVVMRTRANGSDDTPQPWPEPVNILKELAAPPFEATDLPDVLAAYPIAYAEQTGIDRSITLTAAVSAAAAALSDEFQVVADSSTRWMQSPRLWVLTIGRPGAGKTPGQREMISPLWALQRELLAEHSKLVRDLPDEERKNAPPRPHVVVADTTIEAMSEVLKTTERGILVANDEFEGWLGAMDQYRRSGGASKDRAEYLRLFDGGPHTIERVQRGSVFVNNWGVSILSATTPSCISKLARQLPEDGLIQRFIVVCAGRQSQGGGEGARTVATRDAYDTTIRRLFAVSPHAHKGKVPLSVDAARAFKTWRMQNQTLQEAIGAVAPAFEAHLAKYPTLVLRVALVFHAAQIVNLEHEQARDPAAWPVSGATMELAIRFMRRASQHAMPVYLGMKGGSEAFELARDIGRYVIARGSPLLTKRELTQNVRAFRTAEEPVQNAGLRVLVDVGWIRYADGGYTKAQPVRYDVNPALAARLAEEARRERERRAAVRELLTEAIQERRDDA